jgi:hypothetical protein
MEAVIDIRQKIKSKGGKIMLKQVVIGGTYRNKKTGNLYYVLAKGKHTETLEEMVIYTRRGGDDTTIWIRPTELFKEKFEI